MVMNEGSLFTMTSDDLVTGLTAGLDNTRAETTTSNAVKAMVTSRLISSIM